MDAISDKYWMIYILIILLVLFLWISLFRILSDKNDDKDAKRKLIGISIFGPLWFGVGSYMQDHGLKLTRREVIGWISVILLMILAPIISHFLNR